MLKMRTFLFCMRSARIQGRSGIEIRRQQVHHCRCSNREAELLNCLFCFLNDIVAAVCFHTRRAICKDNNTGSQNFAEFHRERHAICFQKVEKFAVCYTSDLVVYWFCTCRPMKKSGNSKTRRDSRGSFSPLYCHVGLLRVLIRGDNWPWDLSMIMRIFRGQHHCTWLLWVRVSSPNQEPD